MSSSRALLPIVCIFAFVVALSHAASQPKGPASFSQMHIPGIIANPFDPKYSPKNAVSRPKGPASFSPMHIIAYCGGGCSGSSYTTGMLHRLLVHNGFKPCPLDGEVLRNDKFSKLIPNGNESDKVRSVIRHCEGMNATAVVFDISDKPDEQDKTQITKYKKLSGSFPVYTFYMYRSNLLYLKICEIMDFGNNGGSYKVMNGSKVELSFYEGRKRPAGLKVHIDTKDLMNHIRLSREKQAGFLKEYSDSFTMEDLSAYEYGNQFALHSVMQWTKVATACGLHFDNFFSPYMMKHVNTRVLRNSIDIIQNYEKVAEVLRENDMEYYLIPA